MFLICFINSINFKVMEKKEKKGFFSSLFGSKEKGCGCGLQIEEVPVNVNSDKLVSDKQNKKGKDCCK